MKDTELRGLLLQKYYEHRREPWWYPNESDVNHQLLADDIFYISEQLSEIGLLEWRPLRGIGDPVFTGMGHITADGINVIEGTVTPPPSIVIKNYTVTGTNFGVVGDGNTQSIELHVGAIVDAINQSSANEPTKAEAKGLLRRFLEHPLTAAIAGAALTKYLGDH